MTNPDNRIFRTVNDLVQHQRKIARQDREAWMQQRSLTEDHLSQHIDINTLDALDPVHGRSRTSLREVDYDGDGGQGWLDDQSDNASSKNDG